MTAALTQADALLREREWSPARAAAKLAPGSTIYVKGKGHAECKAPGEGDGSTLVSLNGNAQTMRLDRAELVPKKEPAMSRTGRPL